ncbi:acetylxylan esterase [Gorillibacterium massiliense]|uniref:acetylxylan esterase n=1 Tax=Gorillibacterium massiliense TaxID=1280390 RepID=UPI0004B30558|nr:acetylxylan esterase [Gorillibacterium massiliense]
MDAILRRHMELQSFVSTDYRQPDFDTFWNGILAKNSGPVGFTRDQVLTPLKGVKAYKIVYEGDAETPIHAHYLLPPSASDGKLPCIVHFHGYTGAKGDPEDYAHWLLLGFAVFAVDVRGQGGETGNRLTQSFGMTKGWITQGILAPHDCYYKAMAVDTIRAVQCAMAQPESDSSRIIAMGTSQGGGMTLLATALVPSIALAIADIPNMCQMDFGILNSTGSLTEVADFLNRHPQYLEQALATLSYFDIVHLAERITVPVRISVGLKDTICMPETVYAAYHSLASLDKELQVNPFLGHMLENGHTRKVYAFIRSRLNLDQ